jgi:hypothetical protein
MGKLVYREVMPGDSEALCALLRETPMGRGIRVCQDRGGDFFAACRRRGEVPAMWAAFEEETGRALGLFSAGSRRVFIGGDVRDVRYLSDLRIHADNRGGMMLARGFRLLCDRVFGKDEWAQTIVLEDNAEAAGLLTSGRAGLPEYRPCGQYRTWFLNGQRIKRTGGDLEIRDAADGDAGAMRLLLEAEGPGAAFTPWEDFSNLSGYRVARFHGELVGMVRVGVSGVTRIEGYSAGMRMIRPVYNGWAALRNLPALPAVGRTFAPLGIGGVICRDRDSKILRALIADVVKSRGLYAIGLDVSDPLAEALTCVRAYRTLAQHYQVGFSGEPYAVSGPFAFDFGCL